ncbi:restriction endonuclease subunit S [Vibrio cholerae]|uniref:restriction endonuclease subunit S n=3 Tax=Vibrio cholerae TaxID=666 RepID=UPI000E0BFB3C|nr:restriction endonuclease subunit S [Vibrio cholerae]
MKVKNSIPTGWRKVTLNEVGTSFNGLTGKKKDDFGNGEPYINYKSVFNNVFIGEDDFSYVKVSKDESQNIVSYGDILITVSSETPEDVGMSSVYLGTKKTYLNSFCFGIKPKQTIDPVFSAYWLRSSIARKSIVRLAQGSTRFNLSKIKFMDIELPLPSLPEQKKIADILSTVDKKIDLIDQKITETEKLKSGLMQKLFSEGVGVQDENGNWQPHTEFQYDSLLGKKPKSWQTETLGNILDIASSKRIKREEYVNEGVPFYRSKEIILKSKQLSFTPEIFISRERFDKLSEKFGSPQQGDILISAVGTIGAIYRVRDEEFYFKDGNLLWIRNIDKSRLSSEFLECYFRSYLCQEMLANLSAGSSQNALTIVKLSKLPLIIPTKDEQKMIVSIISSINEKIYLLKAQKSETQQLKKGLMQKLLTGEWRVPLEETEAA